MRLELNSLDTAKLGQDADKHLGDFETLNIYFGQYLSICFDSISQGIVFRVKKARLCDNYNK